MSTMTERYRQAVDLAKAGKYNQARSLTTELKRSSDERVATAATALEKNLPPQRKMGRMVVMAIIPVFAVVAVWGYFAFQKYEFVNMYAQACVDAYEVQQGWPLQLENGDAITAACQTGAQHEFAAASTVKTHVDYCLGEVAHNPVQQYFNHCLELAGVNAYMVTTLDRVEAANGSTSAVAMHKVVSAADYSSLNID